MYSYVLTTYSTVFISSLFFFTIHLPKEEKIVWKCKFDATQCIVLPYTHLFNGEGKKMETLNLHLFAPKKREYNSPTIFAHGR